MWGVHTIFSKVIERKAGSLGYNWKLLGKMECEFV